MKVAHILGKPFIPKLAKKGSPSPGAVITICQAPHLAMQMKGVKEEEEMIKFRDINLT